MKNMRALIVGLLTAALLATGAWAADTATASKQAAMDKAKIEVFVRHLLLWTPQITVAISDPKPSELKGYFLVTVRGTAGAAFQEKEFYVSEDGSQILSAMVYNVNENPFKKEIESINTTAQPSLGTPGAPVKIVVFSDFECAFCKEEAVMLRQNLIQNYPDQVRLYFVNFPLTSIHPWAWEAAIASRCLFAQSNDAFWAFHDWIYEQQTQITADNLKEKTKEFVGTLQGVDSFMFGSCLDNKATNGEVESEFAQAQELKLNSTPTMFINGRKIAQQIPWNNLKQIIDFELDYQKTAKNAGDNAEDCCSVQLPTPLKQ